MTGTIPSPTDAEITSIQRTGFWIMLDNHEYFVSFEDYPDFQNATVAQIHAFRRTHDGLHWNDLDVDIEIEALKHPENYPLIFKR